MSNEYCPNGFLIGDDYNEHDECVDCYGPNYYACKEKRSMCYGKADFGSKIIATREARLASNERRAMGAYQCSICSGWHIGRQ